MAVNEVEQFSPNPDNGFYIPVVVMCLGFALVQLC